MICENCLIRCQYVHERRFSTQCNSSFLILSAELVQFVQLNLWETRHFNTTLDNNQWRIQDFPDGVRQLPNWDYLKKFLPKTAWKWKNLNPGGGGQWHPWLPPKIHQWQSQVNIKINWKNIGNWFQSIGIRLRETMFYLQFKVLSFPRIVS